MIDFIVSVQFKFFDFIIPDFSVGNFVLRESDPAQRLTNGNHIFRRLPVHLNLFLFKIAEKILPVIRHERLKSDMLFLRDGGSHDEWRLRRLQNIIPYFHAIADMQCLFRDKGIPE